MWSLPHAVSPLRMEKDKGEIPGHRGASDSQPRCLPWPVTYFIPRSCGYDPVLRRTHLAACPCVGLGVPRALEGLRSADGYLGRGGAGGGAGQGGGKTWTLLADTAPFDRPRHGLALVHLAPHELCGRPTRSQEPTNPCSPGFQERLSGVEVCGESLSGGVWPFDRLTPRPSRDAGPITVPTARGNTTTFDVCFHPETLARAKQVGAFRHLLVTVSIEAVEQSFQRATEQKITVDRSESARTPGRDVFALPDDSFPTK